MTTRIIEAAPILSLQSSAYNATSIQWTDISISGIARVNFYYIYRGTGANPSSFALINSTASLSYNDTNISSGVTYTYYVIGQYDYGAKTPQSNRLTVVVPFAVEHLYIYSGTALIVVNAADVNNPFVEANITGLFGSIDSYVMVHDGRYIYLQVGSGFVTNTIYILDAVNPTNPTVVATLTNKSGSKDGMLLVRRGVSTRNNLMFVVNNLDQVQSYDITDPANPGLISTIAAPTSTPNGRGFAYNPSDNKLYFGVISGADGGGGYTGYCYIPVAADGTLSAGGFTTLHGSAAYLFQGTAVKYDRIWGIWYSPDSDAIYYGYPIPSATLDSGLAMASGGVGHKGIAPGRWKPNDLIILPRSQFVAQYQPVILISCPVQQAGVFHSGIGSNGQTSEGMVSFGDYLYHCIGSNFYIHNISNPDSPVLVGSPLALPSVAQNMCGYPDDSWYGNNGLCVV